MESTLRQPFEEVVTLSEGRLDLLGAALLIASEEYPGLDAEMYRAQVDAMADAVRPRLATLGGNPFAIIDAMNTHLFLEQGFRGNKEEYFDPRNSYLNEVLDRRRGIPITLSVIYMEVAARVGFAIEGVGFPGHFLVRHAAGGRDILIDPFHRGEILLPEDCRKRLKATYGQDVPLEPRFFAAVDKRQVLTRMLSNLKNIYLRSEDAARALRVMNRLLQLCPSDTRLLRDRGIVHNRLHNYGRALADLESYLAMTPAADDAEAVRKQIKAIHRQTAMLN